MYSTVSYVAIQSFSQWSTNAWCFKITEKVSFNIASEASYVNKIDQKCIKNAKNGQTVLPDGLISRGQKLVEKSQNKKIELRHFE